MLNAKMLLGVILVTDLDVDVGVITDQELPPCDNVLGL
jgi:hypothetical protein